ncbi:MULTISPECIES: nucleotide-binding protein [unclassified Blastococcus]
MESTDYLRILRRRWAVIVVAGVLGALAMLVVSPFDTSDLGADRYQATATLAQGPEAPRSPAFTALLVTTGRVPEQVAARLRLEGDPASASDLVEVVWDDETGAVTVSATSSDPDEAARIVNTFAEETVTEVERRAAPFPAWVELLGRGNPVPADDGSVLEGPTSQSGRLVLGIVVGLVLGGALALVLERFDTSVRDRIDVQRAYRVPVLAEIPRLSRAKRSAHHVIVTARPSSAVADAYRSLASSVLLIPSRILRPAGAAEDLADGMVDRPPPQVFLITSARSGEGKTTTAVNLAAALATSGRRVLVLDCDLRRPEAHAFLDVPNGPGLSDLIHAEADEHHLPALVRPTAVEGVRLVTAGTMTDEPPALPTRVAGLLADARELADVVIVDSSPMLVGNEAMDLMPYVDTVLLACRSGRLTHDQAERTADLLARLRAPVVGAAFIGSRSAAIDSNPFGVHRGSDGNSERRRSGGTSVRAGVGR